MLSHKGFTLIELLVVVTIIVVLLALLVPAMDRAIELAERAKCAATLHAWGIGIANRTVEHRNKLLSTMRANGVSTHVYSAWGLDAKARKYPDQWSAQAMYPYVQGADLTNHYFGKMWYCPSVPAIRKDEVNKNAVETPDAGFEAGWFIPDYAYFARADVWGAASANRPQDLTGKAMEPGKLLMADAILRWHRTLAYSYNHGLEGYSRFDAKWGGPSFAGEPALSGTNQLTGDQSVGWKDRDRFDPAGMEKVPPEAGWVTNSTSNGQPNSGGDLTFY